MAGKTTQINVKMSEEEKEVIMGKAKKLNMATSEYIRFMALNGNVKVSARIVKAV